MIDCGRCGYKNDPGAKFCAACGAPMAQAAAPPMANAPWGNPPPYAPPPAAWGPPPPAAAPPAAWGAPPPAAPPPPAAWGPPPVAAPPPAAWGPPPGPPPAAPPGPPAWGAPPVQEAPAPGGWGAPPPAPEPMPQAPPAWGAPAPEPPPAWSAPAPAPASPAWAPGAVGMQPTAPSASALPHPSSQEGQRQLVGFLVSFEGDPRGQFWPLYSGQNLVGRRDAIEGLDVPLDSPTTSSRHALLHAVPQSGQLEVEDTGSTNGTFLGEERLQPGARRAVGPGNSIRFGGFTVRLLLL